MHRERGFALLIVLGTLPILSMMIDAVVLAGRNEVRIAGNVRRQAIESATVEGAIHEAILHVAAGEWAADGASRIVRIDQQSVAITIGNENGRINPSVAPPPLLRSLFVALGFDARRAEQLASCIVDYRSIGDDPSPHGAKTAQYRAAGKQYGPTGLPFRRNDELRLVLGMTDDAYARVRPYVSVHAGPGIDLANADPVVRRAYVLAGANGGYPQYRSPEADPLVVRIVAAAVRDGGAEAARSATVQFPNDDPRFSPPYRVLAWGEP